MSPAAKEVTDTVPFVNRFREERLLVSVVAGTVTAHSAAKSLTPAYMDRSDSGVLKLEQAAIEDLEFYRDLVSKERHHDRNVLASCARNLRQLWDRE